MTEHLRRTIHRPGQPWWKADQQSACSCGWTGTGWHLIDSEGLFTQWLDHVKEAEA